MKINGSVAAVVASVLAAAKGVHIRGVSAAILLVILVLAIAGIVYAIRRSRSAKKPADRHGEWPQQQRGRKDPPPWP